MLQFLMSESRTTEALASPPFQPLPAGGERPKVGRMVDVAGMIRQASTSVKVGQLLRSGQKNIQLLSREKIDAIISRAIRSTVERLAAAGKSPDPVTLRRMEAESKQEFDDLLAQQQMTAKGEADLTLSRLALDRELQDMRDDLAQQRALADGRLPAEVERSVMEARFEKLTAHLAAMDQALKTLFSTRLYSYRQIQTLLRQAAAVRNSAERKGGGAALLRALPRSESSPEVKGVPGAVSSKSPGESRRIYPFKAMDLELGRGLDVGSANICAAARKRETGETAYNIQRNVFLDVRDDAFARKFLKYGIDYLVRGERGYVIGDPAFEFANIFEKSVRRPVKEGMISSAEPEAMLIVNHLVEEILGPPQKPGEICVFSVPGDSIDAERDFLYHRSALETVLVDLGYSPRPMLESHLLVFAELKEQDYTGIGLSCGGGMVNVCVAYKGVPTLAFSTSRGGDWIDASVAAAIGLPAPLVCAVKEEGMDLRNPKGRVQEAIRVYYQHQIRYTLEGMKRRMEGAQNLPTFTRAVPLILAGGTAMIPGFVDMFREEFEKVEFPIDVAEIRLAANPLKAVAAGCLEAALSETRSLNEAAIEIAPAALERGAIRGTPKVDADLALHLARLQNASAQFLGSSLQEAERTDRWGRSQEVRGAARRS